MHVNLTYCTHYVQQLMHFERSCVIVTHHRNASLVFICHVTLESNAIHSGGPET